MASNKVPLKGYMDGIDISAWQDTIDITKVPCDFVIVHTVRNMWAKPYSCLTGRDRTIHSLAEVIERGVRSGAIMCTEKPR